MVSARAKVVSTVSQRRFRLLTFGDVFVDPQHPNDLSLPVAIRHFDSMRPTVLTSELIGFFKVLCHAGRHTNLVVGTIGSSQFGGMESEVVLAYYLFRSEAKGLRRSFCCRKGRPNCGL